MVSGHDVRGTLVIQLIHLKSIMEYNGGSVVAMIGKDCVAIASDLRLGQQSVGVAMNFEKVIGCPLLLYRF